MAERELHVFVARDGSVRFVYDDLLAEALRDLGQSQTRRASHVEPTPDGKQWAADMSPVCGLPIVLGPFPTRRQALETEAAWLVEFFADPDGVLRRHRQDTDYHDHE